MKKNLCHEIHPPHVKEIVKKRLALVVISPYRKMTDDEIYQYKKFVWEKGIHSTFSVKCDGKFGQSLAVFDVYHPKVASRIESIRYHLRVFLATITGYVGINPVRVIVNL